MPALSRRIFVIGGAALAGAPLLARAAPPMPAITGPLSGPGAVVWDVSALGYVAEEYLIAGEADLTEPVTMADAPDMSKRDTPADLGRREFPLVTTAKARPYVTRMIVYRPADPARASGRVIVESLHPSGGGRPTVWGFLNGFFLGAGDTHVSLQHPLTIPGLAASDPARYGMLRAEHPSQIWGMLAAAARLIKAGGAQNPLRGQRVTHLVLTGYSYTGVAAATFANFHHDRARLADGRPLFDAYLPMANATYVRPLDVPVLRMNTQSDYSSNGGYKNRRADDERYRLYEVPGAAHRRSDLAPSQPFAVTPALLPDAVQPGHIARPDACQAGFPADAHGNDFPLFGYAGAAFANLYDWLDKAVSPPPGAWIDCDETGVTRLDSLGNALGGLRSVEIEVPAASYGIGSGACLLDGYTRPLPPDRLRALYGTPADYRHRVDQVAERLVRDRLLLPSAARDARDRAGRIGF